MGQGRQNTLMMYGPAPDEDQRRYSPPNFVASERRVIRGTPDERHISTSYVERQNLGRSKTAICRAS